MDGSLTRATYGRDPRSVFDQGAALRRLALTLTEGRNATLRLVAVKSFSKRIVKYEAQH